MSKSNTVCDEWLRNKFLSKATPIQNVTKIIFLDGNIGVGKTTLLESIRNLYGRLGIPITIVVEEIPDTLEKFLKDPFAYAFEMQMCFLENRYKNFEKALERMTGEEKIMIVDRSWIVGDASFCAIQVKEGNLTTTELKTYVAKRMQLAIDITAAIERMESKTRTTIQQVFCYLKAPVNVCLKRIHERGRPLEKESYHDSYLSKLEFNHDLCFDVMKKSDFKVGTLDWNEGTARFDDDLTNEALVTYFLDVASTTSESFKEYSTGSVKTVIDLVSLLDYNLFSCDALL